MAGCHETGVASSLPPVCLELPTLVLEADWWDFPILFFLLVSIENFASGGVLENSQQSQLLTPGDAVAAIRPLPVCVSLHRSALAFSTTHWIT